MHRGMEQDSTRELQRLVVNYPKRLEALINNGGHATKY